VYHWAWNKQPGSSYENTVTVAVLPHLPRLWYYVSNLLFEIIGKAALFPLRVINLFNSLIFGRKILKYGEKMLEVKVSYGVHIWMKAAKWVASCILYWKYAYIFKHMLPEKNTAVKTVWER
jgi:hypothetical protein